MARADINRSGEMEVFVRVVEQGGFSAAARLSRMTPSAVSKLVAGDYLVRVQVDGGESPLTIDGTGKYNGPSITVS